MYRNDLGAILNEHIRDNEAFIKICDKIGFLVVDISPFPLHAMDTVINYRKLTKEHYRQLVSATIPSFFNSKIKAIAEKKSKNIQTFFRYARVKNNFEDLISPMLIDHQIIETKRDIAYISKRGGGIDREKLGRIIYINERLKKG
ncbi:MAG: hypothetical protein IPN29_02970 [Saprospiraceae bacterium]|nr:hypothetical protein [Saprospiraceae bacterium]